MLPVMPGTKQVFCETSVPCGQLCLFINDLFSGRQFGCFELSSKPQTSVSCFELLSDHIKQVVCFWYKLSRKQFAFYLELTGRTCFVFFQM